MAKRVRKSDPAKERYWRGVVRGHRESGESVRDYCREAGVKESAFYWWRRELARREAARWNISNGSPRSGAVSGRKAVRRNTSSVSPRSGSVSGRKTAVPRPGDKSPAFLPVHVWADQPAPTDHAAAVEIHLGDGRMVRVGSGVDRQTLVEVLAALEVRSC